LTFSNLDKSNPADSTALPLVSNTPTILGFKPNRAYRSSDLDSNSFARL